MTTSLILPLPYSQNLINLILTGRCVTNVFDLDKDLGGMSLVSSLLLHFFHVLSQNC